MTYLNQWYQPQAMLLYFKKLGQPLCQASTCRWLVVTTMNSVHTRYFHHCRKNSTFGGILLGSLESHQLSLSQFMTSVCFTICYPVHLLSLPKAQVQTLAPWKWVIFHRSSSSECYSVNHRMRIISQTLWNIFSHSPGQTKMPRHHLGWGWAPYCF